MAISKNKIKYIRSLEAKKNRKAENAFIAEGPKLIEDLWGNMTCKLLAATQKWQEANRNLKGLRQTEVIEVSDEELTRISLLKTPQQVLAVFEQPAYPLPAPAEIAGSLSLVLDDVQDPGNLGTIIRLADWFGIEHIYCSLGTADVYNPKTVQATMGALARVKVHYTPLPAFIEQLPPHTPLYGTLLGGNDLYAEPLTGHGLIIMGNEGNGISPEVRTFINRKLLIPNYPADRPTSESLNVAIATAIVCAEFRRRAR